MSNERADCFYCHKRTNNLHGNPAKWNVRFCEPDGTGIVRDHHQGCLAVRLQELAALHEQIMRYQADPQYDARFIEGQDKTEAALKGQHSADLLAIAEIALRIDLMDYPFGTPVAEIAKEVVAEFREKKGVRK